MIKIDLLLLGLTLLRVGLNLIILIFSELLVNHMYHFNFNNTTATGLVLAALVGSFIITLINTDHTDQPVRWE